LGYIISRKVAALVAAWAAKPEDAASLERIGSVLTILKRLGIGFDLWQSQNIFFSTAKSLRGHAPGASGADWLRTFKAVGELLRIDTSAFLA